MSGAELIEKARSRGLVLWAAGDWVMWRAPAGLTDNSVLPEIQARCSEVLKLLVAEAEARGWPAMVVPLEAEAVRMRSMMNGSGRIGAILASELPTRLQGESGLVN